jgi:hypothetical protein
MTEAIRVLLQRTEVARADFETAEVRAVLRVDCGA